MILTINCIYKYNIIVLMYTSILYKYIQFFLDKYSSKS
jgi:hypothetical protein